MVGKHKAHPARLLARFKDPSGELAAAAALESAGVKVIHRIGIVPGLVVLQMEEPAGAAAVNAKPVDTAERILERIVTLRQTGRFTYVEPDYAVWLLATPNDTAFLDGTLWGLRNTGQGGGRVGADVSAEDAWDVTTGSTEVIVAVIDTGIRYSHQELATQMWRDPTVTNAVIYGTNAIAGTSDPMDDNGHGSHVAGTIGAAANDDHPHVGVSWKVRLMACKMFDANGFTTLSSPIACIDYAVANGAKILNNSWGGGAFSQALQDSIVAARDAGVLFVAAAGNNANNNDAAPFYPASYQLDNIISVAALDRRDRLADFSNYGRTNVHVGAPGVEIFSCWSSSDNAYNTIDGTSMASPHVAGVAALIRAQSPNASVLEMRERLMLGVDLVPALQNTTSTGGRVNAYRSLTLAPDGQMEISITPANNSILLAGSTEVMFVRVTDVLSVTNATVTVEAGTAPLLTLGNDGQAPDVLGADAVYSGNFQVPTNLGPLTVTIVVTAPGEANSTNVVYYTVVPRPPNDDFASASKVGPQGTTTNILSNNRFATMEFGEPRHARVPFVANSLWWTFSPALPGRVFVDTSGSSFDTVLAVYRGGAVDALTEVASVDDVGSRVQGYLNFDAVAGTTYRIAVASYDENQTGTIRLRVEPNGGPDTNAPVVSVTSPPSGHVVTNNSITLVGTAVDPVPNASGVSDVQVKVNEDLTAIGAQFTNGVWTLNSLVREGANTFRIVAIDYAGNVSPTHTVTVSYRIPDPANDLLVSGLALPGNTGQVNGDNTRATKESGEPLHAGNEGGHSVWWYWQAPSNGVLELSTLDSEFDTLLAVYTGDRINSLVLVDANDDALPESGYSKLALTVLAGQTYRVAVDGYGGTSGAITLAHTFSATPLFTVMATGTAGGGVASTATGSVASNTVVRFTATPDDYFLFAGWEGSVTSISNPLEVTVTKDVSLIGRFVERSFSDGFESGDLAGLPWASAGHAPWTVQEGQVRFGQFAARSGTISHLQRSSLILTGRFDSGRPASFEYRVSSEEGWDKLEFLRDGVIMGTWSGETGWDKVVFDLTAGEHTLEWRYSKDSSNSAGEDAAYLDNLDLPFARPVITTAPADVEKLVGEAATFTVVATDPEPLTYQWQKDGSNLSNGERISGADTATLQIGNLSTNDAGNYTVQVSNSRATAVAAANLAVSVPPAPIIRLIPEVVPGGPFQFRISYEGVFGQQVDVQASQNLGDLNAWSTIATLTINSNNVPFIDPASSAFNIRFYRTRAP